MYYSFDDEETGFRIPVHFEKRLYRQASAAKHNLFFPHHHATLELFQITSGTMTLQLGDEELRLGTGCIAVANPFLIHSGWCQGETVGFWGCFINLATLMPYIHTRIHVCANDLLTGQYRIKPCFRPEEPETALLNRHLDDLRQALETPTPEGECTALSAAFSLFSVLFSHRCLTEAPIERRQRDIPFLSTVSRYLAEHYQEDISSATASRFLNMEQTAFCHKFRRQFGDTFSHYLCRYRLLRAISRYSDSTLSVSRIAAEVGFSDYCHFSRSFKAMFGQSPAVYFHKWKANKGAVSD